MKRLALPPGGVANVASTSAGAPEQKHDFPGIMPVIAKKGTRSMARLRVSLTKLFVLASLSLGQMPRLVALLDLFHTPSTARVLLTRKRNLAYADFFTILDRDGRRAAPIARPAAGASCPDSAAAMLPHELAGERYIRVDAA
jgi:hypothetical protein